VLFRSAENRYLAEDACELITVDYDELPAIVTPDDARNPDIPAIFDDRPNVAKTRQSTFGDVDAVFGGANRVVRAHIDVHRHQNVPMEGQAIVVDYQMATGEVNVYASTQGVHAVRGAISAALGVEPEKVHIFAKEIGGSFGLKFGTSREQIGAAIASRELGRPVKWVEDRSENLTVSGQAREESFDLELAVNDNGDVLGLKIDMVLDQGAYPGMGAMVPMIMQGVVVGPYRMKALDFRSTVVSSNKASYIAYRGPWASETFLRERMLDLAAKELGIDPFELRTRNVASQADSMITGRSLRSCTARESLERVQEMFDFADFRRRQQAARAEGRYLGVGVATFIEGAPGPRGDDGKALGREQLRATIDADGTVLVFTGQMPHGQGHQTTFAQIAADQLGVPFEQIRVVVGDSDQVPPGSTGGSMGAAMAGGGTLHVARSLKERIREVCADVLEASVEDIEVVDGKAGVRGAPGRALSFAELATAVEQGKAGADASLEVAITYEGGEGGWSGGTHCVEVEVDVDTGLVHINRYIVVQDCGELINPAIVEGQIRGGVAQGIGAVLLEKSAYDENGQFLAASFMDYLLPSTTDVPTIEISHLETVPLDADVNFRGIGEGGMIVAPAAIVSAIEDALAPFGVRILEQHLPPNRILELIGAIEPE
ncbi:MAG: xanthine dehydrogenase family protein molybdopterin-binding subunit, partial [Acidimicrobiia bacterium]